VGGEEKKSSPSETEFSSKDEGQRASRRIRSHPSQARQVQKKRGHCPERITFEEGWQKTKVNHGLINQEVQNPET